MRKQIIPIEWRELSDHVGMNLCSHQEYIFIQTLLKAEEYGGLLRFIDIQIRKAYLMGKRSTSRRSERLAKKGAKQLSD